MAQVRCGQGAAQASSRRACDADARTRSSPSGSSAGLIATAVCEPLCGSTPIITATTTSPPIDAGDRGGHALFQGLTGCAPLPGPRHGKEPTGRHVVNKPGCTQPTGGSRASPSDPLDTTATTAAPAPILQ
jgi:hypothetical protein